MPGSGQNFPLESLEAFRLGERARGAFRRCMGLQRRPKAAVRIALLTVKNRKVHMVRLFVPSDHTGTEQAIMAALNEIHATEGIAEIVATTLEGAPRYAVSWAMMNRVSYRLCVPEPMETGDLYVLNPFDAEP